MLRLAMWSGPRTISTAMMRSWENRPDTVVCDEPLYAHYLRDSQAPHPGAWEIIAHHDADWQSVVRHLTGWQPDGATIFYQKQMSHHLLPHIGRDWLGQLRHAFLIRDPREMLLSYVKTVPRVTLSDTGLPQQVEIFNRLREDQGRVPPVIDSRDVLENPRRMLELLCVAWDVEFMPEMLSWPSGPRASDGIWARHWYDAVERSTGFAAYRPKTESLPQRLEPLYEACLPYYETLYAARLGQ
jgi:hypothetical protein